MFELLWPVEFLQKTIGSALLLFFFLCKLFFLGFLVFLLTFLCFLHLGSFSLNSTGNLSFSLNASLTRRFTVAGQLIQRSSQVEAEEIDE